MTYIKNCETITQHNTDLTNSGNTLSSGAGVNLSSGGNMALVGAQISGQGGVNISAGGNYTEQAAYDVHEQVNIQSSRTSGVGTYLADALNNTAWLATAGAAGGRTETARTETHIDSTRTAVLTQINGGAGEVNRTVGGNALVEGSVVSGAVVNPLTAGGSITAVAAVDSHHVENSLFTSTIRWQGTDSSGHITQTLHMPEIHGSIPAGLSAYQGAGGVSVQLPAGANVRTAIEAISQEPGKEYLTALANRSDVDWQRVEVLNQSLDFSQSGLTQEAAICSPTNRQVPSARSQNPRTNRGNPDWPWLLC